MDLNNWNDVSNWPHFNRQQWQGSVDPNTLVIQSLQSQLVEKDAEIARLREQLALMSLRAYAEHEA